MEVEDLTNMKDVAIPEKGRSLLKNIVSFKGMKTETLPVYYGETEILGLPHDIIHKRPRKKKLILEEEVSKMPWSEQYKRTVQEALVSQARSSKQIIDRVSMSSSLNSNKQIKIPIQMGTNWMFDSNNQSRNSRTESRRSIANTQQAVNTDQAIRLNPIERYVPSPDASPPVERNRDSRPASPWRAFDNMHSTVLTEDDTFDRSRYTMGSTVDLRPRNSIMR